MAQNLLLSNIELKAQCVNFPNLLAFPFQKYLLSNGGQRSAVGGQRIIFLTPLTSNL